MHKGMKFLLALALMSDLLMAGGKDAGPVTIPYVPIPEPADPSPWYAGVGLVYGSYLRETAVCRYEDQTSGIMARVGYEYNEYLGFEARAIKTLWGEGSNGGEKLEHLGIFAKPTLYMGDRFRLYGLVGYGQTKTINEGGNGNLPEYDETGFSWGAGIDFDLSGRDGDKEENKAYSREFDGHAEQEKGWGLFIDYQRLIVDSNLPDMKAITVGIRYDF